MMIIMLIDWNVGGVDANNDDDYDKDAVGCGGVGDYHDDNDDDSDDDDKNNDDYDDNDHDSDKKRKMILGWL